MTEVETSRSIVVYIDADACPVKDETYRVAGRYGLHVYVVANSFMALPREPWIERVVVSDGFDAADDWIAEEAHARDVIVTADILLAARVLERGAAVIGPDGRPFTPESIGTALSMRSFNQHLRETGESKGLNKAFTPQDRSRFRAELDRALRRLTA